jgi:hypothetical protein
MVVPTFVNGKAQVNKKPAKYVPKKNYIDLFNDLYALNNAVTRVVKNGRNCVYIQNPVPLNTKQIIRPFKANTSYTLKYSQMYANSGSTASGIIVMFRYLDGSYDLLANSWVTQLTSYVYTSSASKTLKAIEFTYGTGSSETWIAEDDFQLEEGSTATPYESYQLVLPKAKTGLSFNGVTDYLQLPSMTMDSIEIDCLIDSVQPNNNDHFLLDARTGLANGYLNKSGNLGAGFSNMLVDGVPKTLWTDIPKGQRTKVKVISNSAFTDDVLIFNRYTLEQTWRLKGTLYKVTCYLAGSIVATYDFENTQSQVGTTVLDLPFTNLIPSFDDARWSLHANTQVLGKDYLRLNATGTGQNSYFKIPFVTGVKYMFDCKFGFDSNHRMQLYALNADGSLGTTLLSFNQPVLPYIWTADRTETLGVVVRSNGAGTFDFVQPKLFQLDGKEGTLNGSPTPRLKRAKRILYNKR